MFLVVADDLTGASEIGGVAVVHGLSAEVHIDQLATPAADVVILDTDTRSRPAREAAHAMRAVGGKLSEFPRAGVFKKVDSVLRGPVLAELSALMQTLARRRTLLVPANPTLGRTISGGHYRINGRPIHETGFRNDPEYPMLSSDVLQMLAPAGDSIPVHLARSGADLPATGIVVGETSTPEQVAAWAKRLDRETLAAGAADFFAAILQTTGSRPQPEVRAQAVESERLLLVSGTGTASGQERIEQLAARGVPVFEMPARLTRRDGYARDLVSAWAARVIRALRTSSRVVVTIGQRLPTGRQPVTWLTIPLARLTAEVLDGFPVENLWIEGGSTASAVVRTIGWRRLEVESRLSPGVVCLRPSQQPRPRIVMKPGSYPWPEFL